ncbi:MAG TPA: sigma 54-interacting transcriptional regulator [Terrimicrobiaceae bacterium]|nr:sigma 54-interacting transcriptional regulator [Terrimicrobiaceae bacterium]
MSVTLEGGAKRRIREDKILRFLVEGTVSETGSDFFRALVRNLSEALQTYGAWITEYLPESRRLRALAFWTKDGFLEHFEHSIDGTPCQAVIETRSRAHFPERLLELYPDDPDIKAMGAVSYMGTPLLDTDGTLIGHLAVLDNRPMPAEPQLYELFDLFAARAVAELRRLRAEAALRDRQAQLSLLLDTAMDAILVLDGNFRITRLNPRATELFACTEDDLAGECFLDFLSSAAAAKFSRLIAELQARPDERPLWLPEGLEAIRWDKAPVPAEAAISRYLYQSAPFYTVFLRSMSERLEAERRIRALIEETESLRAVVGEAPGEMGIVGRSAGIRGVCNSIRQVAPTNATVLILGETGTGKELVARAIHETSPRREQALVRVNCAAIPESLIESEFFGHEKGAFTGATTRREGRFAQADGGTLFLDEVGELPLDLQAKLLRVLQEGEFEPVGGTRTVKVNVRVIAATNRTLEDEISTGRFREDLYYRLNVFPIRVPALRERGDDICLLAEAFVRRFAARIGRRFEELTDQDRKMLRSYDWPGNVRELQNVIERALILSPARTLDLGRALPRPEDGAEIESAHADLDARPQMRVLTAVEMEELEKRNLLLALDKSEWKISGVDGAASLLGLPASTIASRIKALGIRRPSR